MVCIFVYIVIYSIWYQGLHFDIENVTGLSRLQWQEPVLDCNPMKPSCLANYTDLADLPYCHSYNGSHPAAVVFKCGYFEAWELPVQLPDSVLLPTKFLSFEEEKLCGDDDKACEKKYAFVDGHGDVEKGSGHAVPVDGWFVANAEDFTLLIDHNFKTVSGSLVAAGADMQGYWEKCDDGGSCNRTKIRCIFGPCEDFPDDGEKSDTGPFSIPDGDVFSVRHLMDMANISMEDEVAEGTRRSRGFVLVVDIVYNNKMPWSFYQVMDPPEYTITSSVRPVDEFKQIVVDRRPGTRRSLSKIYGMDLRVVQSGEIASFDLMSSLILLTTTLSLLFVSDTVTLFLAKHVMPRKAAYRKGIFRKHHMKKKGAYASLETEPEE